jgi:hypothetical protein
LCSKTRKKQFSSRLIEQEENKMAWYNSTFGNLVGAGIAMTGFGACVYFIGLGSATELEAKHQQPAAEVRQVNIQGLEGYEAHDCMKIKGRDFCATEEGKQGIIERTEDLYTLLRNSQESLEEK